MKTLNSVHGRGMAAGMGGISVLAIAAILLLSFAPFFSFAAGTTVTVQTSAASYPAPAVGGESIPITGSVSPAPGASGYSITLTITNTAGLDYVVSTSVNSLTGAFSYTLVTGTSSGLWVNGTYTVTGIYTPSINSPTTTGSTTFQYGAVSTTSSSSTSSTGSGSTSTSLKTITTVVNFTTKFTTTAVTTISQVTTITQGGTTITSIITQGGTTITSMITQPGTTVVTTIVSSVGGSSATAEAIGAVGVVIAIIAGAIAVMALRKH